MYVLYVVWFDIGLEMKVGQSFTYCANLIYAWTNEYELGSSIQWVLYI